MQAGHKFATKPAYGYLKALNDGDYEEAGRIYSSFAIDLVVKVGSAGAGAALTGLKIAKKLKKITKPFEDRKKERTREKYEETASNRGWCSFHGDTLVATDEGLLPIRDVTTEMSVASRDPMTGAMSMKPVQAQYSNPYDETVSVSIRDVDTGAEQTIVSNRIHPYFVQTERKVASSSEGHTYIGPLKNGHWVDAAELQAGDRLLNDDGTWAEVVGVEIEAKPLTAYNLTVSDFHTYFVAANENAAPVWMHNNCVNGSTTLPNGRQVDIRIDDSRVDHVLKGDVGPNGPTGGHSTNSGSVQTVGQVEVGHGGVRRAQVEIHGQPKSNNGGVTTLFPDGWSDQRIVTEFSQGLRTGATSTGPGGNPRVVTPSGVTVEYVRSGDRIVTFYPIFE
ncbi:polymorphic toxin-type HINT domain-containing protein [Pseudovibrio sp. Ad37]|uniref:polymorphic toxin-type HINT domain-containing protein n=1 Tax=Pseudovibrio sp. Ad37 TaxID=989422 RepID=UPI0007AE53EF|nr:polymorphic toxin-type HINT domain-containing protein [Pseudovibrio sp. Ad37]KZL15776.1 hypothetical protein PsAD37_04254 [Pseudovibrio sp. Ad37]